MSGWITPALLLAGAAYLVGGIPFGYLVARARGIDIRAHGSGNIGATNVGRVLGRKWGLLVFALDAGKCFALMWAARATAARHGAAHPSEPAAWLMLAAGLLAIVGNVAPVYLRFRGGKAVAASVGVMLGAWPDLAIPAVAAVLIWYVVVKLSRYVSLGSIVAALLHPLLSWGLMRWYGRRMDEVYPLLLLSGLLVAVILVRHRANIGRLLAGTEKKVGTGVNA